MRRPARVVLIVLCVCVCVLTVQMARSWTSMRAILETLYLTLPSIGYLSIVLGIFIFISAVLGMQAFGAAIPVCDCASL